MDHLRSLGNGISVPIPADENGLTGRECQEPKCERYFKIEFGTGLKGKGLPCHCPHCGHTSAHDRFWTKEQIQYAKSVAMRTVSSALHKDLKKLEFERKPQGAFGIGMSLTVKQGRPTPIHYYRVKQLETEVVCASCTLRYSVCGVFAFYPDCGQNNSLQILEKNLMVVGKMLDLANETDQPLAEKLTENALEDCVSAFDGYGRELCRVHAKKSKNPAEAERTSFQNLDRARTGFRELFGIDMSAAVAPEEWRAASQAFQKRHLFAHKLGVVDQDYIKKTGDTSAVVGRKISVDADEVRALAIIVGTLTPFMSAGLHQSEEQA